MSCGRTFRTGLGPRGPAIPAASLHSLARNPPASRGSFGASGCRQPGAGLLRPRPAGRARGNFLPARPAHSPRAAALRAMPRSAGRPLQRVRTPQQWCAAVALHVPPHLLAARNLRARGAAGNLPHACWAVADVRFLCRPRFVAGLRGRNRNTWRPPVRTCPAIRALPADRAAAFPDPSGRASAVRPALAARRAAPWPVARGRQDAPPPSPPAADAAGAGRARCMSLRQAAGAAFRELRHRLAVPRWKRPGDCPESRRPPSRQECGNRAVEAARRPP